MSSSDEAEAIYQRDGFFRACQAYIKSRDDGGYLAPQASRLLLKYVKNAFEVFPLPQRTVRNFKKLIKKMLDKCPEHRITIDTLVEYELVMRDVEYAVSATGVQYTYDELLREAIVNGEPKVLVKWAPSWDPVANIRRTALARFRARARERRARNRAANRARQQLGPRVNQARHNAEQDGSDN